MIPRPANSVEQVSGGNVIKQGDNMPLGFIFRDQKGNIKNLQGAEVTLKIADSRKMLLEKSAKVNSDNEVTFSLSSNDVTGSGDMRLEFQVLYSDGKKEKFPADDWQEIRITPSLDDVEEGGASYITIEKIREEYQGQIDTFKGDVSGEIEEFKKGVSEEIVGFKSDVSTKVSAMQTTESNLKQSANDMREQAVRMEDSTNQSRSLASEAARIAGIANENSEQAVELSQAANDRSAANEVKAEEIRQVAEGAKTTAEDAKKKAEDTNKRIDTIVAGAGQSNTEIVDMRTGADGVARKTAGELTREMHKQLIASDQQTATLQQGVNVVTSDQASALDIQVPGRTLVSLGNSVLTANKPYVLTNDAVTLIFSDTTSFKGNTKFKAPLTEKPSVTIYSDYKGKVQGSVVENGAKYNRRASAALGTPNELGTGGWFDPPQGAYDRAMTLNGNSDYLSTSTEGNSAQFLHSFDVLQIIERHFCKIPGATLAERVSWARANLERLVINWYGLGVSNDVYKATIRLWNHSNQAWGTGMPNNTKNTIEKINMYTTDPRAYIDNNGYCHLIAYAEPSNGSKPSTLGVDFVEIFITPKATADFSQPCMPLYEVTQAEYDNAFITWNEAEVLKRYPPVTGAQSVVDPVVTTEGANLLPPFTDEMWQKHPNTTVLEPYKAELNRTANGQYIVLDYPVVIGQTYSFCAQAEGSTGFYPDLRDEKKISVQNLGYYTWGKNLTFTVTNANVKYFRMAFTGSEIGKIIFSNPILTLGQPKPFVPRNTDSLKLTTPLRSIKDIKDLAYKEGEKYKVSRRIKVRVLDETRDWLLSSTATATNGKVVYSTIADRDNAGTGQDDDNIYVLDPKGRVVPNIDISVANWTATACRIYNAGIYIFLDNDVTGWASNYTPTTTDIKNFFKANPHTLLYTLANPVVEEITFEGALSIPGTTQVTLSQGGVAPIVDAPAQFASSLKSSFQQMQTRQTDLEADKNLILQAIADLYKQMAALGG